MLDVKSELNGGDEQEKLLLVKTEAIARMCIEKEQFTEDGKSFLLLLLKFNLVCCRLI